MTGALRLRPARRDEAAALSALAQEAKASWGYPAEVLAAWRAELTVVLDDPAAMPAWVAEFEGTVAGFAQLRCAGGAAELEHLWVRPGWFGRGAGRALVARACAEALARGCAAVRIDADPNAAAFYRACGARHVGDRPAPITGAPDRVRPQFVLPARPPA